MANLTPEPQTEIEPTGELTAPERHELLGVERRRTALDLLADVETPVDLRAFAVDLATAESNADSVGGERVREIELSLHHNHLPRMGEMGVLDYDPSTHLIEP